MGFYFPYTVFEAMMVMIKPLTPSFHKKVILTLINLQLSGSGFIKFLRPFCGHQELKG